MTHKEFAVKLNAVRKQIFKRIQEVMGEIGPKVCVRMYQDYDLLHDTEDCYEPIWDLEDMTVTDANYLLEELEDIVQFHEDNPDKEILKEYDADFDWEGYLAR